MLGRKPRAFTDLVGDPACPYWLGRLTGAAEMAARLLSDKDDPDVQRIGQSLASASSWFLETNSVRRRDEEQTQILPPKR